MTFLDMGPIFITTDTRHQTLGNIEFDSNLSLSEHIRIQHLSDSYHLFIIQFSSAMFCSLASGASSLHHFVSIIFSDSAKEKMIRIYTSWIVTFVKYFQMVWYWSITQHPRYSMTSDSLIVISDHSSIPVICKPSQPRPTFIRKSLMYFLPKASLPHASFLSLNRGEGYLNRP